VGWEAISPQVFLRIAYHIGGGLGEEGGGRETLEETIGGSFRGPVR